LAEKQTGGKTKDGVGVLLGVTQVMTRNWLSEFNISIDRFHGYLNDPYKFTSIINSAGGTTDTNMRAAPISARARAPIGKIVSAGARRYPPHCRCAI
jgi:hypothetical protein